MMLDIIRQPISTNSYLSSRHDIVLCYTATKIQSVYGLRDNIDYPNSKDCGELPRLGSDLTGGLKDSISTLCLINGNHWVAIVVNQSERKVLYGDPGGSGAPVALRSSLIIENGDEHEEILDEDTHTWLNDKIEKMPGDSTFDAEEDIDLDVPELTKILADDPPQGSVSKGKKSKWWLALMTPTMLMANGSGSEIAQRTEVFSSRIVNNTCFRRVSLN
ncbi:uncharacterized protein F5891DRAFT_1254366 [Suillus fuscotomentosus]|uniref:Ubiquitin-like protease family profile domain-containing protein n=1 Tax=Suillus fuscotomentosus TaxID=1912939 RepID=A0AAD4HGT4_9AGAM|nr:uncharacterized protein F5891DRAFT_1254366 [Suillus fuscotomentosus]KAG1894944.1 hypothetical protein F5891DRAFT_1254366 [Suillus fuscotomentosus]